MINKFFKDSLVYTIPSLVSKGISFFLIPLYTRVLSPSEYGSFDLIIVFGTIISIVISLEISQGVARFYSEETEQEKKQLYASTSLWFILFSYSLFFLIALIFNDKISFFLFEIQDKELLFQTAIIYIFFNSIFLFIQNQLRWDFQSINYAAVSILMSIITGLSSVYFAYVLDWGLLGLLRGMILGSLCAVLLGLWYLRNTYQLKFKMKYLKQMLNYSLPLVFSSFAIWISLYIDRIMIKHFMSLDDVGIYGIGFKVASSVSIFLVGFNTSLTPLVFKNFKKQNTPAEIAKIFRFVILLSILIYLILSLFSELILKILATESFYKSSELLVYLVPAIIISSLQIFAPGISIAKRTHYYIYIFVFGGIINLILNYILIPNFGTTGAAIATLLGNLAVFVILMIFSQKLYYIPHKWFQIVFSFLTSIIIVKLVSSFDLNEFQEILINLLSIFFLLVIIFKIKMTSLNEIRFILNKFQENKHL